LPGVKNKRNAKSAASTSALHTNKEDSGEYFPSWLGSKAYKAACTDNQ